MFDLEWSISGLISKLKKAGYVFYDEPTSECGSVELVKVSR